MRTASGKLAQISNSRRAAYGYDQRIEVHGSTGMARADNVLESTVEIAGKDGFAKDPAQHFFLERYAEAYRRELAAFINAVAKGKPTSPSGRDGLQAQRLATQRRSRARREAGRGQGRVAPPRPRAWPTGYWQLRKWNKNSGDKKASPRSQESRSRRKWSRPAATRRLPAPRSRGISKYFGSITALAR